MMIIPKRRTTMRVFIGWILCLFLLAGCSQEHSDVTAFVGADIWDGTGSEIVSKGVILVEGGRILEAGSEGEVVIPSGAQIEDLGGRTIVPGLINTHGHVGGVLGLESGHYNRENLIRQLRLYADYGITTVNSLGGDGSEGKLLRDEQAVSDLNRARLYIAGEVIAGTTQEEVLEVLSENAELGVDWMKIRVDDNLGSTSKMSEELYSVIIDTSHELGFRLASHLFYLEDAKGLLRAGTDFIAHSVRDVVVDEEFLALLRQSGVCYSPTLTREVSTFVYENRPDFFDDPFFLEHSDPEVTVLRKYVLEELSQPSRQQAVRENVSAQGYKRALPVAMENLNKISDAGLPIGFGTDTGPAGRFQGFFEHMELVLMERSGMSSEQILRSATGQAAKCLGLEEEVGTLQADRWADFIVLTENPLEDVRNMRTIESVWIAGNRIG
jgi:imidazolonepropionase-like amidohydrolase